MRGNLILISSLRIKIKVYR